MTIDYETSYEIDEHRVYESDIEYAWAFAVLAVVVLAAVGLAAFIS